MQWVGKGVAVLTQDGGHGAPGEVLLHIICCQTMVKSWGAELILLKNGRAMRCIIKSAAFVLARHRS
jgi:hypothetical protein